MIATIGATVLDMNLLIQMITAVAVAYAAWAAHHARADSKATKATVLETQANIQKIETATNSMKDDLVKTTALQQFAAGKDEARIEGEAKAATLAEGQRTPLPADIMKIVVLAAVFALTSCATQDPNEHLTTPMISSVLLEIQREFQKPLE